MAPAPGAAAGALNGPHAVADRPAGQRDKPGERVVPPLARHDRAEVGRVDRRGRARAGQGDRARLAMAVVEVHIAADQRILVRSGRQPGQQLGESNARRAGGDRGERAAILGRSFGLGVKEIEMARTAPQPDEQDRFGFRRLGRRQRPLAGRRQGERSGEAGTQKRPATHPLTGSARKAPDVDHRHGPLCGRFTIVSLGYSAIIIHCLD